MVLATALCGPAPSSADGSHQDLVWPPPPSAPRIRFLQTFSTPKELGISPGLLRRLGRAVKGGDTSRRILRPHGVFKDSKDRLYVVDTRFRAVHAFDVSNAQYYRFPEKPTDDFLQPIGIAVGDDGRAWITDSEAGVVHVFLDRGKRYLQAIGHDVLQRPTGIALSRAADQLLVVDTLASRIVVFDTRTLAPNRVIGADGSAAGEFHFPTSVFVAGDGKVLVADSLNFRVQVLSSDFELLQAFGRPGDAPGDFSRPKGVAADSAGNIYVVDALFDNVQVFDRDGRLLMAFGKPGQGQGQFWLPSEIFIDEQDRIYVSDSYNQRVQVFQYLREAGR